MRDAVIKRILALSDEQFELLLSLLQKEDKKTEDRRESA